MEPEGGKMEIFLYAMLGVLSTGVGAAILVAFPFGFLLSFPLAYMGGRSLGAAIDLATAPATMALPEAVDIEEDLLLLEAEQEVDEWLKDQIT